MSRAGKHMTFMQAIRVLMLSAQRDVQGCGMGYRSTSDEWREKVSEAWTVCFKKVNGRTPDTSAYYNSGMPQPVAREWAQGKEGEG